MNAPIRKFATALSIAAATAGAAGCVGAFNPEAAPTSPVAARVQTLVEAHREYPRWTDFPRSPEPAPEPARIAAAVTTLKISGAALAGEISRIDWTLTDDPAAFAAAVQARIDAVQVAPVTQETLAEIDEFARRSRERGRAPPPVDRR